MPARRILQSSEVNRLIAACRTARERLVVLALVETGLRASELARLESGDLNREKGLLRVPGRERPCIPSPVVFSLLAEEFRKRAKLPRGVRQIQRIVRAIGRNAALDRTVTPDVLRRTWLSMSAPAGANSRRASARLLQAAADAALDIILVADDDRRFVDVNRAAADMLGLPRQDLIGRRIEEFFSEIQGKPVPVAWTKFVADGEQRGLCNLASGSRPRTFEYRAKAHFRRGFHMSILREIPPLEKAGNPG